MLLIPNALCWSSRKCNCACALPAEVHLRLCVTHRSWQKLFTGKIFVKMLVTVQTQLRSYSEQQRAFGNSIICNWDSFIWVCNSRAVISEYKTTRVFFPITTLQSLQCVTTILTHIFNACQICKLVQFITLFPSRKCYYSLSR